MTAPLRLLIVADVGGDDRRHIGDEAMLEANLDGLRYLQADAEFTLVSRDPAWVAERYRVAAVGLLGFSAAADAGAQRAVLLKSLLDQAGHAAEDSATVAALRRADALLVSGGGNLSSSWPDLLYERAALILLAQRFGKAIVVLGQTLGPHLAGDERELLAQALPAARFLGVREMPTAALALQLGFPVARLWYQTDDAWLLEAARAEAGDATAAPHIAVTIDPQMRALAPAVFETLVVQLRELARSTQASLLLLPHAFGAEGAGAASDLTEARVLADRLALPQTTIAGGLDARQARRITGEAALVISTRYHPLVFGLSAGVPALGIYADDYCRIKLQGALLHAGRVDWSLSYAEVAQGQLLSRAMDLWNARDAASHALGLYRPAWIEETRRRWVAIGRALDPLQHDIVVDKSTIFGRAADEVVIALASTLGSALAAERRTRESGSATVAELVERHTRAEQLVQHLQQEIGLVRTLKRYAAALLRRLGVG